MRTRLSFQTSTSLDGYDVLSLRALLASCDGELDLLAFGQGLESVARDVAGSAIFNAPDYTAAIAEMRAQLAGAVQPELHNLPSGSPSVQ